MPTSRKHRSNGKVVYVPKGEGAGLPENIQSTLKGYEINGNVVTIKGHEITVNKYEEITDKALLNRFKNIEDPVLSGRGIMPRAVAERAIEQGKQERANYKANMEKNVKGYDELTKEISSQRTEYERTRKQIERGEGFSAPKENRVGELKKKYPRAASYLEAEKFAHSTNYEKSALGKEAMTAIRTGKSHTRAIEDMKKKWAKYTKSSLD